VRQLLLASGDYFAAPFKRWLARFFTPEAQWNRNDQERAVAELGEHLDALQPLLSGREYLCGTFSLADIGYAPMVCELASSQLEHLLVARPAVQEWVERLRARPAVRSTSPFAAPRA
jgi:glutathione S-transferase